MKLFKKTIAIMLAVVLALSVQVSTKTSAAVSADGKTYTVEAGDTLKKIAEKLFGQSSRFWDIYDVNRDVIKNPDLIYPGQALKIPDGKKTADKGTKASEGFKLVDTSEFGMIGADIKIYEHVKTGAKVMFVENGDTNRCFNIAFKTPDKDNTGTPHVFEHVTLSGSEKYPSEALFFNLSYQTYGTYLNAATYSIMTTFPCASLSEDQLLKYADYYTDSVFHPMVMENESLFKKEGWRYNLQSADDELIIDGTVYSEMKGALDTSQWAYYNNYRSAFPGSMAGNVNGGDPEFIPDMTWEQVKDFHDTYYLPSNSLTTIYGKIEKEDEFLALLDSYFSEYEKTDVVIEDSGYKPLTESVVNVFEAPLEEGADTENGSYVYYTFLCGDDPEEEFELDMLTTLINDSTSVFQQNMRAQLRKASAACYVDYDGPETLVYFYCEGINEEDVETFKKIVDESIESIAKDGFDADAVDAIIANTQMSLVLTADSTNIGPDITSSINYYWALSDDELRYVEYSESLEQFRELYESGKFTELIKKYLVNADITSIAVTVPVAGLKDKQDEALRAKLAEIKESLSNKEIKKLIKDTEAYLNDTPDDASELVKQLTAVTVESLPEEVKLYNYEELIGTDIPRRVDVKADISGVGEAVMLFDASGLKQDQIHYFKLFTSLIGQFDTSKHSYSELQTLMTRYLYNGSFGISLVDYEGERGFVPYLRTSFIAMDEDLKTAYDLAYELLFQTRFDDVDQLKGIVTSTKTSVKNEINSAPYAIELYRQFGRDDEAYAYYSYANYLDYYYFLCDLEAQLEADPDAVIANLKTVQKYFKNRTGLVLGFVGNETSIETNTAIVDKLIEKLDEKKIKTRKYDFGKNSKAEAIIVDGAVNYNTMYATWDELGVDEFAADWSVITSICSDIFMIPTFRDLYGAYGAYLQCSDSGLYSFTYRDQYVGQSYSLMSQLADTLRNADVDQDTLDGYILSTYSGYATPAGELAGGNSALMTIIAGREQIDVLDDMKLIKSMKAEDVAKYADVLETFVAKASIGTVGPASAIAAESDLFTEIINPFGAVDRSTVEFTDVTEDDPFYTAIRMMYEEGYMEPESETTFGAESAGTLGDLAGAFYAMLGGGCNPEDGIAYLSYYGVLPMDDASTALTREDLLAYCNNFAGAMGVNLAVTLPETTGAATRADVAWACAQFLG